ncbi:MAG: hypothetical protein ACJA07_004867, partial [Rhodococcus sp. (in: high G+C Gram-positive bacteria)]
VRIGSVGSPILSPQQGISRLTRTLSGYLIGASRLNYPGSMAAGLPGGGPGHFVYPGFIPGIG